MRLVIATVGKLKDGAERELFARYWDRIAASGRSVGLAPIELREIAEGKSQHRETRLADEAERLAAKTRSSSYRILLDERGKALTSTAFAAMLRDLRDRGEAEAVFVLGGPDGHGEAARGSAQTTLSLGLMTLPHGLARIVLIEQIYRAVTILSGHPYHRE
jgi:23S rRNA (pseudouridine1915-N3)-methyltransferase